MDRRRRLAAAYGRPIWRANAPPGRRPGDPRKSRLLLQGRPSPPGGFADTWPAPQRSDRW